MIPGLSVFRRWQQSVKLYFAESIVRHLLLWIVMSSALATALITGIQLIVQMNTFERTMAEKLDQLEQTLVPNIVRSTWLMDTEQTKLLLSTTVSSDPSLRLHLLSDDGEFAYGEKAKMEPLVRSIPIVYGWKSSSRPLGVLNMEINRGIFYQDLWRDFFLTILNNFFLVFFVVMMVAYICRHIILKPLSQLANLAGSIQYGREVAAPSRHYSANEIGAIYRLIENLQEELKKDYEARIRAENILKESKTTLQKLVVHRNKELDDATKVLMETSHKAGMAEVAQGVLHNIGNVLVGSNAKISWMSQALRQSRFKRIPEFLDMIDSSSLSFHEYMSLHPAKAASFHNYLKALVLEEKVTMERQVASISDLDENLKHIGRIISSQRHNAKHRPLSTNFSLRTCVLRALNMYRQKIESRGVEVDFSGLYDVEVNSDLHKVLQILTNLITNAIDAVVQSEKPKIEFRISQKDRLMSLTVKDNGIGIEPNMLPKLFQFGFTTKSGGSGFGLHTSALDAAILGGRLTAYSNGVGHGATFILELPIGNLMSS